MSMTDNGGTNGPGGDGQTAVGEKRDATSEVDGTAQSVETTAPSLEEQLDEALQKLARTKEKMLRTAADFDNFRKRTARDAQDIRRRGTQAAVKELLPVFDSMERATAHIHDNTNTKSMADGINMVLKQFISVLGKMNIERIDAVGQVFDPSFHDSIQHEASDEYDAGTVMAEVQAGYMMGDDLLRPSMVMVSRGPSAPDAGAPDTGAPDAGAPDAGAPDTGAPDTGAPDAGAPDAGAPDAGAPDAGAPDAGAPPTGQDHDGTEPDDGNSPPAAEDPGTDHTVSTNK
jgi:molecular chaperone GrpE